MKSVVTDDMILMLGSRDAAKLCGCTARLWRLWDRMGYTPMPMRFGKRKFWKLQELVHWIDAGCPKREIWMRAPNANRKAYDSSPQIVTISKSRGHREKKLK